MSSQAQTFAIVRDPDTPLDSLVGKSEPTAQN
jgi:hypothetical protein